MNDKELLEYAALAMGKPQHVEYDDQYGLIYAGVDEQGDYTESWNPLTCSWSLFEIVRKLHMGIDFNELFVYGYTPNGERVSSAWGGLIGGDEAHAVLRVAAAIASASSCEVAAEIGKRKAGK